MGKTLKNRSILGNFYEKLNISFLNSYISLKNEVSNLFQKIKCNPFPYDPKSPEAQQVYKLTMLCLKLLKK